MTVCPSCGHENREGQKFCGECGSPLGPPARPVPEERKVITSLFCDLIGFTTSSESADPEDVDRMLTSYSAMARAQIEAHGGVVEKFIGDAVVGIFGVPVAHEDDPERAVRAGLRITEDAEELEALGGAPLRLRVGINTGEALVRLGITPSSGERFLAGDAINTSSRLQSVAPEMGVAVGVTTYEATASVFDYTELEPAMLKGKFEPVRVFHAKALRVRVGTDLIRTHDTPFIGREIDLALLRGIFEKGVVTSSVQLVTVVGEPGLGKSRLVAELDAHLDIGRITWRQGRCLPYGEGITFWALGEIVKAHAGILESDAPKVAQSKLDTVLPEGPEREWFRQRLLPLLGIEATSSAEREELFTAWRRFLEQIAKDNPTVLVFEDLHWADDAMLSFLEHLAAEGEAVPLLVVGTARPELFERLPGYAAGLPNVNRINLSPLSDEETAHLVSALLETTVLPIQLQQPIVDRSEGNPLYAEEFVRLLRDKNLLVKNGSSWELKEGAEVPFPDSVQALIAARLDTLGPEAKSMLADAAVLGKVFWAGAVAQMGGRDLAEVTETLRVLSRKELVRLAPRSSIEGEAEHAFWHILTRDVAYAQLPRASRAARHVAAAAWIESKVPERIEDLSYHYAEALEFARAAGQTAQATELEGPALRFLTLAGDRALGLDTAAALGSFEGALALTPPGHPERPEALARFGEATFQSGRLVEATGPLEEAIAAFRTRGDLAPASRAMVTLAMVFWYLEDPRHSWTLPAEALALLEPLPPGPELVDALTEMAIVETMQGRPEAGVRYAEQALALGEDLGLDRSARALGRRGMARSDLGQRGGLEDVREAIALATQAGQGREVAQLHNILGYQLWVFEGPAAGLDVMRAGIAFARAHGIATMVDAIATATLGVLFDTGNLDEILELAAAIAGPLEDKGVAAHLDARAAQVRVLAFRGLVGQVAGSLDWIESTSRASGFLYPGDAVTRLGSSAFARAAIGQYAHTRALLTEIDATPRTREYYTDFLPAMVRTALMIGDRALAELLVEGFEPRYPYDEHALTAATAAITEARGDLQAATDAYAVAAERWEGFGVVPEQAFALLGLGRCLVGLARPTEAVSALLGAREVLERLGAAPALLETDGLLQQATAVSS